MGRTSHSPVCSPALLHFPGNPMHPALFSLPQELSGSSAVLFPLGTQQLQHCSIPLSSPAAPALLHFPQQPSSIPCPSRAQLLQLCSLSLSSSSSAPCPSAAQQLQHCSIFLSSSSTVPCPSAAPGSPCPSRGSQPGAGGGRAARTARTWPRAAARAR